MSESTNAVSELQNSVSDLRRTVERLERDAGARRRNGWMLTLVGVCAAVVFWATPALSAPASPSACDHADMYCFTPATPAIAAEVSSNFATLHDITDATRVVVDDHTVNKVDLDEASNVRLRDSLYVHRLLDFPTTEGLRQMINLWGGGYGIGIQSSTQYYRSNSNFAWYVGGGHNDTALSAGGGSRPMYLDSTGLHGPNLLRVTSEVSAVRNNIGGSTTTTTGVPIAAGMCFLTEVSFEDIDAGGEIATCEIVNSGGFWAVRARLNATNDHDAWCQARCIRWD